MVHKEGDGHASKCKTEKKCNKMGTVWYRRYFLNTCLQKRTAYVLRLPLSLSSVCLTPTVSGAHMWAEWLHHPCLLGARHMGTKSELAT